MGPCDDDLLKMALEFSLDEGGCRANEKGIKETEESYREMEKGGVKIRVKWIRAGCIKMEVWKLHFGPL